MVQASELKQRLAGLRVLVAEDELLIGIMLEQMLCDLGCQVSVRRSLVEAQEMAERSPFDLALLDIDLAGIPVFPLARALSERAVPFAFVTGDNQSRIPAQWMACPTLHKPFDEEHLSSVLARALALD